MKKNLFIFLICSLFFVLQTAAQQTALPGQMAPLNPEFVRQQQGGGGGFASPVAPVFRANPQLRAVTALPSRFDLRSELGDNMPEVRDQGAGETCWAFATMDAVQLSWWYKNNPTPLLSPENLVNCHGFDVPRITGGKTGMTVAYLSRYGGPVFETADPYPDINSDLPQICNPDISKADKADIVGEVLFLPDDIDTLKQMVQEHGAVMSCMHRSGLNNPVYYNEATFASYVPNHLGDANHAITIVGWDDDFTKENFATTPNQNGAWIIRNTTGTDTQDGGYFYASYEDYYVGTNALVFPKRIEKTAVDTIYFYDKLGHTKNYGLKNEDNSNVDSAYVLVRFYAPQKQMVTHIGTNTTAPGAVLDFGILKPDLSPLYFKGNLPFEFQGYHTIVVDEPVFVEGDFYAAVKYKTSGYNFPVPVNDSIKGYATVDVMPSGNPPAGFQYIKLQANDSWISIGKDAQGGEFNACIKVYAKNASETALPKAEKPNLKIANPLKDKILLIENAAAINRFFLTDLSGKTLVQGKHSGEPTLQRDLSALPLGVYLLLLDVQGSQWTEKIILK